MPEPKPVVYSPRILRQLREFAESDLYMKRGPRDLTMVGSRHGRLVVQRVIGMNKHRQPIVLCHCDCGNADIKLYNDLQKNTKSCGCLAAEKRGKVDSQLFRAFSRLQVTGFKKE